MPSLEDTPGKVPSVSYLQHEKIQALVVQEVAAQYAPAQLEFEGVSHVVTAIQQIVRLPGGERTSKSDLDPPVQAAIAAQRCRQREQAGQVPAGRDPVHLLTHGRHVRHQDATSERDAGRWLPYPYLRPSKILQSISI